MGGSVRIKTSMISKIPMLEFLKWTKQKNKELTYSLHTGKDSTYKRLEN